MADGFQTFQLQRGSSLFATGDLSVHALSGDSFALAPDSAHWVLVTEGVVSATLGELNCLLPPAHYLATPGSGSLQGGHALVIVQRGYRNVRQFGGPLEPVGRLRYVDGCSDTLLVCPPRLGEPCLNHLHIPAHTRQTEHHHPSLRIGVIARGAGVCHTPLGDIALSAGMGWLIPAGLLHSFSTNEQALDVFAWHPDSDFGPADQDHPMINRTLFATR